MADLIESTPAIIHAKVGAALVTGTVGGLMTLIDPAKFRPSVQRSWIYGTGALAGGAAWFGTGAPSSANTGAKPGTRARIFVSVGLAALMALGTKLGFVVDSTIHHALLRRGVTKPRAVMAVTAGVLTAAMALVESMTQDDDAVAPHEAEAEAEAVQESKTPLAIPIV